MAEKRPASSEKGDAILPSYEHPPVAEVSLGIHFGSLALRSTHQAEFWAKIRDRYPRIEEQPPVPFPPPEMFGQQQKELQPMFTIQTAPPVSRWLYMLDDDEKLIQLQPDLFAFNWRMQRPESIYPRYANLRGCFLKEFDEFKNYVASKKLGEVAPSICELTYVNRILPDTIWQTHDQIGNVFRPWSGESGGALNAKPEDVRCLLRYLIGKKDEQPLGRLYVSIDPAFQLTDKKPIFIVRLTARGNITGNLDKAMEFMDIGHEWIVNAFDALTTDAMHLAWGKIQ